jgi:hypothetical protein
MPEMDIFAMSNMTGKMVKTDDINFSFYFSEEGGARHANRAKVRFNREKISQNDFDGFMELHGDFKWHGNRRVSAKQVNEAREFFKKYSVLFDAVWVGILNPFIVQKYFNGLIQFKELISEFDVDESLYNEIQKCKTLEDLSRLLSQNGEMG